MKSFPFLIAILLLTGCGSEQPKVAPEAPVSPVTAANTQPEKESLQMRSGTDFYAHGQKPSWTLELDYEGDLIFSTRDGDYMQCPIPEAVTTLEGRVVRYHAVTDSGVLDVTIEESSCTDPLTGKEMGYTVVVEYVNAKDQPMPAWEGCGTPAGGSAVAGTWRFAALDGAAVNAGSKGQPDITFNIKTNQVSGNGGCNRFSSTLKVKENQLEIGLVAATKMACPDSESETKLLQRLSNATFHFEVNGLMLTLSNAAGEIILEKAIR